MYSGILSRRTITQSVEVSILEYFQEKYSNRKDDEQYNES